MMIQRKFSQPGHSDLRLVAIGFLIGFHRLGLEPRASAIITYLATGRSDTLLTLIEPTAHGLAVKVFPIPRDGEPIWASAVVHQSVDFYFLPSIFVTFSTHITI
jgi:hypothetical protein